MPTTLIFLGLFSAGFVAAALAVSFAWAWSEARTRHGSAQGPAGEGTTDSGTPLFRSDDELSTIRLWRALLERISQVETLRRHIAQANLKWSAGRVTLMMLLGGSSTAALLSSIGWIPWPAVAGLSLLIGAGPYWYLRWRRRKRFEKFSALFPDALDSLSRALKAGYPLSASIELLAQEQPEPLSGEMRRMRDEWRLGHSWDEALDNLAERIPVAEVRLFAAAVKLQNRVGGRLNEVLARMSETMRESSALASEVRSVSAHSRMTGLVLTILPLAIGALMFVVNPDYMLGFLARPMGRTLVMTAATANVAAHFLIKRLARVRM
jgi:tight adherence protein B